MLGEKAGEGKGFTQAIRKILQLEQKGENREGSEDLPNYITRDPFSL